MPKGVEHCDNFVGTIIRHDGEETSDAERR